jgi:predicted HTH transcriptional regulator
VINNQVIEFAETEEVLKERIRERKLPLFLPVIQKIEAEPPQPPSIKDLRQQEESDTLEFKSTLQWDVKQSRKNEELQFEVLGTIVGFMNHEGGTLLIGVQDDHSVLGLEPDLNLLGQGKNLDDFQQLLNNFISDRIGTAFAPLIKIRFEKVEDKEICAIDVKRAAEPVFLDAQEEKQRVKKFYIRQGNTTRLLDVEETHHYTRLNWK